MEVFVCEPLSKFSIASFPLQSDVRDLVDHYLNGRGLQLADFYVKKNGRLSGLEEKLQPGAVYRLEPRLCGGKGGFGSMLRALGAQIEKTTNREACRDLSGRRLRDVNHEKEMAEWLKKQAERDAEKEQRRLERLQRKLAEPRHHFTDPQYEQQCHDLSERLEDSVLKGMQASSSGLVKVHEAPSRKRPTPNTVPKSGKKKCFWTGAGGLEDLSSSDDDSEDSPSTSASGSGAPGSPAMPGGAAETTGRTSACLGGAESEEAPGAGESSASGPSSPESSTAEEQASAGGGMEVEGRGGGGVEVEVGGGGMEVEGGGGVEVEGGGGGGVEVEGGGGGMEVEGKAEEELETAKGAEEEEEAAAKGAEEGEEEAATGTREERTSVSVEETSTETAGLKKTECDPSQLPQPDGPIDLQALSSVDQLEALGLERLKAELTSRGMKCGGTLAERAARLFSTRGLSPEQIPPALLAKPSKGMKR